MGLKIWVPVAATAAVLLALSACSGGNGSGKAADDSSSSGLEPAGPDSPPNEEDETPPATVMQSVAELGLPPEISECVLAALPEGSDPGAVSSAVLGDLAVGCVRSGPFARQFVAGLAEGYPGVYSADELVCLGASYGELSDEQVGYLVASGLKPQDPPPEAQDIADALFGECGVEPPK